MASARLALIRNPDSAPKGAHGAPFFCIGIEEFQALCQDARLRPSDRLVYLMLLRHRNHQTGQTNPSHATLARETGLSASAVRHGVGRLREAQWIRTGESRGASLAYTFPRFRSSHALTDGAEAAPARSGRGASSRVSRGPAATGSPETGRHAHLSPSSPSQAGRRTGVAEGYDQNNGDDVNPHTLTQTPPREPSPHDPRFEGLGAVAKDPWLACVFEACDIDDPESDAARQDVPIEHVLRLAEFCATRKRAQNPPGLYRAMLSRGQSPPAGFRTRSEQAAEAEASAAQARERVERQEEAQAEERRTEMERLGVSEEDDARWRACRRMAASQGVLHSRLAACVVSVRWEAEDERTVATAFVRRSARLWMDELRSGLPRALGLNGATPDVVRIEPACE